MLRYIRGVLFWIKFWLLTVGAYLGLWVFRFIFWMTGKNGFDLFCHRYAKHWAKAIMHSTPGWTVEITGQENIPRDHTRFVLVSNHESMADIWVIFLLDIQFRWLAKAELFRVPIIGRPMTWAGYIPIKRGDKDSHVTAMTRSAASVQSGVPMLYFPEGTRSDGEMRPFKIGAFKLAVDTGTSVLPIVLKGARQLIPKGSWLPATSHVRVRVLPLMARLGDEDLQDYAARVRGAILAAYNKM